MRFGRRLSKDTGNHVFVAGLARSGSTLLMRLLYESGAFCSLTYRDMPFVLCPNSWHQLASLASRRNKARERAHGDGILVDFDSPEALEEVFWRTFCGSQYIHDNCLLPMTAAEPAVDDFRVYIGLILQRYGKCRYLSKNNNNILRLPSLLQAFPEAHILVPFRRPLEQASSLLSQHQRFVNEGQGDSFVTRYMSWLGHHEFGLDHRPFMEPPGVASECHSGQVDYWLDIWGLTYEWLLDNVPQSDNVIFVNYETLCSNPEAMWKALSKVLSLTTAMPAGQEVRAPQLRTPEYRALSGIERAEKVYGKLMVKALKPEI